MTVNNPTKRRCQAMVHIRWMIKRDMEEVCLTENETFITPWKEEDFTRLLKRRDYIGMVAELNGRIVAHTVYQLRQNRLVIRNLTVSPHHRREGIGRAIMDKLKAKLSPIRKPNLIIEVREENLQAQLFLRSQGFKWIKTVEREDVRGVDDISYVTAYRMRFILEAP